MVGDTGEGDASQFAVVPPMLEVGKNTAFMVICSDVIYPSGDAEDYEERFYRPYENYARPIYALPGNHDWYVSPVRCRSADAGARAGTHHGGGVSEEDVLERVPAAAVAQAVRDGSDGTDAQTGVAIVT